MCRTLGRSPTPTEELERLGKQLDEAYRRTAANLPGNAAVTIDRSGRHDVVTLTPLDKLDEPASLPELRRNVAMRLPRVDLTEVLLEIQAWTNFASEFRHISEGDARVADLDLSLCAVLLAEACNIGLEPLVRPDVPALTRGRRPSTLGRAIGELGRVAKTLYLLNYLDDEAYRRRILTQLNRGESRHGVARAIFHGQRGELRQRYREGQEDQLGALGLVVNAVVLWNTRYLDAALAQVRATGRLVKPEDVERLSPLLLDHVNVLGRYEFALKESVR